MSEQVPPRDTDDWSYNQMLSIDIANRASAFISLLGSSCIIFMILHPSKRDVKLKLMYHRLMLGLSVHDFLSSFWSFIGPWAMPEDSLHSDLTIGNYGTWDTCTTQGFFIVYGYISCILFNAVLSLYFLLFIKYSWREAQFRKIESYCLLCAMGIPATFSIFLAFTDSYNPTIKFCFIQSYPINCENYDEFECVRGEKGTLYQALFAICPIVLGFFVILICMTSLYLHVRKIEMSSEKYRFNVGTQISASSPRRMTNKKTKQVLKVACWYVGVFIWIWAPTIASLVLNKGFQIFSYHLELVNAMLLPIQGFLNAIVYARNDVSKFMGVAKRRISSSLFSSCTTKRKGLDEKIDDLSLSPQEISLEDVDENDSFEENH